MDVVESEWGKGADLDILASKIAEDTAHTIKAVCIVHNETATGVTNNLATVRKILGNHSYSVSKVFVCFPCQIHLPVMFIFGITHVVSLGNSNKMKSNACLVKKK